MIQIILIRKRTLLNQPLVEEVVAVEAEEQHRVVVQALAVLAVVELVVTTQLGAMVQQIRAAVQAETWLLASEPAHASGPEYQAAFGAMAARAAAGAVAALQRQHAAVIAGNAGLSPGHHAGHHHFLAMRLALLELAKLGCRRPAALIEATVATSWRMRRRYSVRMTRS